MVTTLEDDEEVGRWDVSNPHHILIPSIIMKRDCSCCFSGGRRGVRLFAARKELDAVRLSAAALLGELKAGSRGGGGKRLVAAAGGLVVGGVMAGAQHTAVKLAIPGRASRSRQDSEATARVTPCTQRCTTPRAALPTRPQPPLLDTTTRLPWTSLTEFLCFQDCVEFLSRSFETDRSVVLLKAGRVLGAALSTDSFSEPELANSAVGRLVKRKYTSNLHQCPPTCGGARRSFVRPSAGLGCGDQMRIHRSMDRPSSCARLDVSLGVATGHAHGRQWFLEGCLLIAWMLCF